MTTPRHTTLVRLLQLFDVETLDEDLFLGNAGRGEGTLFGGFVAAQSFMAAGRTVPADRSLHSLHAYFLRPGRHDVPIRYVVDRIRDGRSFTTRRVKAHQAGEAIFNLSASFAVPEEGISHQDEMPKVPPPDDLEDWEAVRARILGDGADPRPDSPLDVRMTDTYGIHPGERGDPIQRNWFRVRGELPNDPLLHTAMLIYATDRTMLGTASRPHGLSWTNRYAASLDHAVWVHRPVVLDDWFLYACESPVAHAARGLIFGGLYYKDGTRLASVAQEALIRGRR